MNFFTHGTPLLDVIEANPLDQRITHSLLLYDYLTLNGDWNRSLQQPLNISDDVSDIYEDDFANQLHLTGVAMSGVVRALALEDSLGLTQVPTVAGGRTDSGGAGTPPVQYLTDCPKGAPIYIPSTGHAALARGNNTYSCRVVGVAQDDMLAGNTGHFIDVGWIERDDWTAITGQELLQPNAHYYLSTAEAGKLTTSPPSSAGNYVVVVGLALDETAMLISITDPLLL